MRSLHERAVSAVDARRSKLALCVSGTRPKMYILYDAEEMLLLGGRHTGRGRDGFSTLLHVVCAVVMVNQKRRGRQWNASEIEATAALHGYGPLLYDIAMAMEHGLIPDRDSVSPAAKNVWRYYLQNRDDVVARELDDEKAPRTKTKVDDAASLYPGRGKNPLNYAYEIVHAPAFTSLINNHNRVVDRVGSAMKDDDWQNLGQAFFDSKT